MIRRGVRNEGVPVGAVYGERDRDEVAAVTVTAVRRVQRPGDVTGWLGRMLGSDRSGSARPGVTLECIVHAGIKINAQRQNASYSSLSHSNQSISTSFFCFLHLLFSFFLPNRLTAVENRTKLCAEKKTVLIAVVYAIICRVIKRKKDRGRSRYDECFFTRGINEMKR